MSYVNGIKIFYSNTDSIYANLNLDIEINKWVLDTGVELVDVSLSTGRLYYKPGKRIVHFDVLAAVNFKFPTEYGEPSAPTNLIASDVEIAKNLTRNFTLSWDESVVIGANDQKNIEFYLVYIKKDIDADWTVIGKTQDLSFFIDGLAYNTTYNVKVSSIDVLSVESPPSSVLNITIT